MIAKALVQNGARVYISSRKADVCDAVAAQLNAIEGPGECISLPADLASDAACVELAAQLAAKEDKLHILFNNAGATWGAPKEEFPEEAWEKVMTLNVTSVFQLTRVSPAAGATTPHRLQWASDASHRPASRCCWRLREGTTTRLTSSTSAPWAGRASRMRQTTPRVSAAPSHRLSSSRALMQPTLGCQTSRPRRRLRT